jgi:phosphatidylinositol alpha-mannosyltransferase
MTAEALAATERPLRIAQLCPYDIDRPGGVQTHVRDTSRALEQLGHEVTIIAPRVEGVVPVDHGLEIERIGRSTSIRFGGTGLELSIALRAQRRRLGALMRESRFDLVHYHAVWTPLLPLQAYLASPSPSIATFHDTPADTLAGRLARAVLPPLSRAILPHFDAAIAVSASPRAHLRPAAGQQIAIIPPCTDLSRFRTAAGADRGPDQPVTILFVGRLEPRKGCGLLLEAYRRLRAEGCPARLVIVGTGPEEAALRAQVDRDRSPDVVFAGRVADADLPRHYAECDIFCSPAPYGESFGVVLTEAMAAARPVVAAANSGYTSVLQGDAARFLTRPGDPASLHLALRELVLDGQLRRRLGAWGAIQAADYDCRTVAPRLVAAYRRAILNHPSRRARAGVAVQCSAAAAS